MKDPKLFNRDLSWLSFNERVLMEAADERVPLYERIKFLAIYSSNLDEFFRVRVALIQRLAELNKKKLSTRAGLQDPDQVLASIISKVNGQQDHYGKVFRNGILPGLKENKIVLYHNQPFLASHKKAVEDFFYFKALSFIQPIVLPIGQKSPLFLEDKQLYIVTALEKDGEQFMGVLKVPSDELPRFVTLPMVRDRYYFCFLEDVIKEHASKIYPGYTIGKQCNIKLSRDAELFLSDEYAENIAEKIRNSIRKRKTGAPSRLLFEPGISPAVFQALRKSLKLRKADGIEGGHYHNMDDLFQLPNPVGKTLEYDAQPSLPHPSFQKTSVFDTVAKEDVLLAFPYHRYDYILRFFNEAVIDPSVTHIKLTLYRIAKKSAIANALISAAKRGKKVSVLVEAKARFDEENNLEWSKRMQAVGIQVKYSDESIKVHSKIALIHRKDKNGKPSSLAFLGTGNFNEKTASIYTDYALLTSNAAICAELDQCLDYILGEADQPQLKKLLVSQVNMPQAFQRLVDEQINAPEGKGRIILKMNNLQDPIMIGKLYEAADKGVKIDLIVRGICCIVPQSNIRIRRIVDRYLEHARVYLFGEGAKQKIYVGSADWMERNLYHRIEVVFPVEDNGLKAVLRQDIQAQLHDNVKAVELDENLDNQRPKSKAELVHSQQDMYGRRKAVSKAQSKVVQS